MSASSRERLRSRLRKTAVSAALYAGALVALSAIQDSQIMEISRERAMLESRLSGPVHDAFDAWEEDSRLDPDTRARAEERRHAIDEMGWVYSEGVAIGLGVAAALCGFALMGGAFGFLYFGLLVLSALLASIR